MNATSKRGDRGLSWATPALLIAGLLCFSVAAAAFVYRSGYTLYYGDAQAHLSIARRVVDSRTPGYEQLGTVWLPLPHVLMLPFVGDKFLWHTGLAGAIPSMIGFVIGGLFLYLSTALSFESRSAGVAAVGVFAMNPNVLYLQSVPMTETLFFAASLALLYCTLKVRETQSTVWVVIAGLAALAATLIRYEAWALALLAAIGILLLSGRKRIRAACLFAAIASLGPLYWLAHNWWFYGSALEFYYGPYSARAIYQRALDAGMARYPGDHDWSKACQYYLAAVSLCLGPVVCWVGTAGAFAALLKRRNWQVLFLLAPPAFYIFSLYSSGTPIYVPHLWPNSYYNTRYGLAALPLLALGAGALVTLAPHRQAAATAILLTVVAVSWVRSPGPEASICWKESQVNSAARRAWTAEAAAWLRAERRPGEGIFASFGDLSGIFREAGIPLSDTLYDGNHPHWDAALGRPDLFLWEPWAVAIAGDEVDRAVQRARRAGTAYNLVKTIAMKGGPVIEIYRRDP